MRYLIVFLVGAWFGAYFDGAEGRAAVVVLLIILSLTVGVLLCALLWGLQDLWVLR